jgi:hypothetical protein
MGSKKKSAPEYSSSKADTDIWGSSTHTKKGTTYTAPEWMSSTMGTVSSNINPTLSSMLSNDYSNDANFKVYQDNFNRQAQQAYDANVLNPLANRGLMRSSGLQAATNSFNNTMANNLANLQDSYYNRQVNNLSNSLNSQNQLYSWITGLNNAAMGNSQAVSNHYMDAYKADQALKGQMYQALATAISGTAQGAGTAAAAAAASDINVKENIKKIGEKNGYNWYEFTYKKGLGLPEGRQEGVIAQEVELINPDAVIEINGIKHVDYSKI